MEEILASIRRIMADEEPLPPPGRRAPVDPATYAPKRHEEARRYEDAPPRGAPPRWDARGGEPRPGDGRPYEAGPQEMRHHEGRHPDARHQEMRPHDMRPQDMRPQDLRPQDLRPQEARPQPVRPREARPAEPHYADPRHGDALPFEAEGRGPGAPRGAEGRRMPADDGDFHEPERRPRPLPPRDLEEERGPLAPRRAAEPRDLRETLARPAAPGTGPLQPPQPMARPRASVTSFPAPEAPGPQGRRKDLLSPAVDAAVTAAFGSLGDLVLPHQDRTVEDLVKEILRPMLKEWLDKNLPDIVERLVRQEIERVARTTR